MMKIAILATLIAAAAAAPVSEDTIVPESVEEAAIPEIFAQESGGPAVAPAAAAPPCTDERLRSGGASGSTFRCSGPGPRNGHINYDITVPKHCTSANKCGLIVNIHGQGMNAAQMEADTGVAAAALAGKKYIVIAPDDTDASWELGAIGGHDDAQLMGEFALEKAMKIYKDKVDTNRIHATGYSMGAINSYVLLCKFSAKICSAAGIAFNPQVEHTDPATGHYVPGVPTCFNSHMGGKGPTHKRSLMVHLGTKDPYFAGQAKNALQNTVSMVKSIYGMSGDGEKLNKGPGVDWTRYTHNKLTFEAASYKFTNPLGWLSGHCVPKKGESSSKITQYWGSVMGTILCGNDSDGDVSAYSWGKEAIKFLEAHPCK